MRLRRVAIVGLVREFAFDVGRVASIEQEGSDVSHDSSSPVSPVDHVGALRPPERGVTERIGFEKSVIGGVK